MDFVSSKPTTFETPFLKPVNLTASKITAELLPIEYTDELLDDLLARLEMTLAQEDYQNLSGDYFTAIPEHGFDVNIYDGEGMFDDRHPESRLIAMYYFDKETLETDFDEEIIVLYVQNDVLKSVMKNRRYLVV